MYITDTDFPDNILYYLALWEALYLEVFFFIIIFLRVHLHYCLLHLSNMCEYERRNGLLPPLLLCIHLFTVMHTAAPNSGYS